MVLAEAWPGTAHQPHRPGDRDLASLNHSSSFNTDVSCLLIWNLVVEELLISLLRIVLEPFSEEEAVSFISVFSTIHFQDL